MSGTQPTVVPFEQARKMVEEHAARLAATSPELVALTEAFGRVLAEALLADRDFPPFPRSARDGYAVRASDVAKVPTRLRVAGEVKAGADPAGIPAVIETSEAAAIMTGAPVPKGADSVLMVEYTSRDGEWVEVLKSVAEGENIVPQASEARSGETLIAPGQRLDAAAVAVAASVGKRQVRVYGLPSVAILATGDEIVDITAQPGPNQIRNSNTFSLAAQVWAAGGRPVLLPIAADDREPLSGLVEQGLGCDLLLLAGGVSMGKYDLVEEVLAERGAEFLFTGALIQPGKPVVFGRMPRERGGRYFFGLPGNPVSTMVTFELFARPMIEALGGASPRPLRFYPARLEKEITVRPGLTRFLPGMLCGELSSVGVALAPWHGSGDVAGAARANCYVVVPPDREHIAAGDTVAVLPK
jgi:molybdopterin molybdotransferase